MAPPLGLKLNLDWNQLRLDHWYWGDRHLTQTYGKSTGITTRTEQCLLNRDSVDLQDWDGCGYWGIACRWPGSIFVSALGGVFVWGRHVWARIYGFSMHGLLQLTMISPRSWVVTGPTTIHATTSSSGATAPSHLTTSLSRHLILPLEGSGNCLNPLSSSAYRWRHRPSSLWNSY